jgi:hypothetical protein
MGGSVRIGREDFGKGEESQQSRDRKDVGGGGRSGGRKDT